MKEDHELQKTSIPSDDSRYTEKQGQYLAFIHYYTKINRYPPAEADMQRFFKVSPPSVHRMLLDLEKKNLIDRTPRQPRSIRILLLPHQLPELL
jgi:DNA-binding MarR family transcriptional regulator